jgi:predicted acetyltransferase
MNHSVEPSQQIEVIAATAEQIRLLDDLLQLYARDFSEFHNVEFGPNGRFEYKALTLYWSEPCRHPFLLWVDGQLAGFALVKKGSEVSGDGSVCDMAEFFVLRAYRRRGIGTQMAHEVWRRFSGPWEVRVMHLNVSAQQFWTCAIAEFTGKDVHPVPFEKDGESWMLLSFVSKCVTSKTS